MLFLDIIDQQYVINISILVMNLKRKLAHLIHSFDLPLNWMLIDKLELFWVKLQEFQRELWTYALKLATRRCIPADHGLKKLEWHLLSAKIIHS